MSISNRKVIEQLLPEHLLDDRFGKIYVSKHTIMLMDNPTKGLQELNDEIQTYIDTLLTKRLFRNRRFIFTVEWVKHPYFRDDCIKISWRSC